MFRKLLPLAMFLSLNIAIATSNAQCTYYPNGQIVYQGYVVRYPGFYYQPRFRYQYYYYPDGSYHYQYYWR